MWFYPQILLGKQYGYHVVGTDPSLRNMAVGQTLLFLQVDSEKRKQYYLDSERKPPLLSTE